MASTNRIYLTAGDTLPTLEGVLTDDAGTAEIGATVVVRDGVVVASTARQATRKYHVVL